MADMKSIVQCSRVVERFWGKVRPAAAGACWEWADKPDQDGYGRLLVAGVSNLRAHRIAAALFLPDYSDSLVVRHDCDNPRCCNPAHLRMGTQADNIADREARGRGNHAAKLPNIMRLAEQRRKIVPHKSPESDPESGGTGGIRTHVSA